MKPANIMLFGMMLASLSSAQASAQEAELSSPPMQIHTPAVGDSDSGNSLLLLEEEKDKDKE